MKTIYILLLGLLVSGGVMAQSCLPEGITFETQAQIDSFHIIYPNCTEIEGQVTIGRELQTNDFTNLNGLNMLTSIGGNLLIQRAPDLTNLEGLNNVTSIGGNLALIGNSSLNSLSALENLTSINGALVIGIYHNWGGNPSLISLSGLENVSFIGGGLEIAFNDSLTTCAIESICDYIANPNGEIFIYDNSTGCDSIEEVETACEDASVDELSHNNGLSIYPNPSSSNITIELPTQPSINTSLTLYNLNGQQLITQAITELKTAVDVSGLPRGVYFVKMVDDENVMVQKVIKQ